MVVSRAQEAISAPATPPRHERVQFAVPTAAMVASSRRKNPSSVPSSADKEPSLLQQSPALMSASANRVPISTACPANLTAVSTSPASLRAVGSSTGPGIRGQNSVSPSKRRSPRAAPARGDRELRLPTCSRLSSRRRSWQPGLYRSAKYALNAPSANARSGRAVNQAAWASASRSVAASLSSRSAQTRRSNASCHRCSWRASRAAVRSLEPLNCSVTTIELNCRIRGRGIDISLRHASRARASARSARHCGIDISVAGPAMSSETAQLST